MNFGKRDLGLVLSETVGDADTLRFTKDARCARDGWCFFIYSSVKRIEPFYVCMFITYSKGKDQPGKVANPARVS